MDLVRGCWLYFLTQKQVSCFCWWLWVLFWSHLLCCQLEVTPLKPAYRMKGFATFTYSAPYSIICPSFQALNAFVGISLWSTSFVSLFCWFCPRRLNIIHFFPESFVLISIFACPIGGGKSSIWWKSAGCNSPGKKKKKKSRLFL